MKFLMGERYSLHIYCHRIENLFVFCLELDVIELLREARRPLHFALRKALRESLQFDQYLGTFSVILQSSNFYKKEFTDISSVVKTAKKITKILQYFSFSLKFESLKSVN